MRLHNLKPIHKSKKRKRVGRGGKRGTYSGKGIKGQKARAGKRIRPALRDLIKRIPKLRGVPAKRKQKSIRGKWRRSLAVPHTIINIKAIEKKFSFGDKVSPQTLLEKGMIRKIKGGAPKVKLLGSGELTKKLLVENCQISKGAKEKIEKVGGIIK